MQATERQMRGRQLSRPGVRLGFIRWLSSPLIDRHDRMYNTMIAGQVTQRCCGPVSRAHWRAGAPTAACKATSQQQDGHKDQQASRRSIFAAWLATAAAAACAPAATAAPASLTPFQRGLQLEYGLTADGRIRACETDANPNCVGTANRNEVRTGLPGLKWHQHDLRLHNVPFKHLITRAACCAPTM